MSYFRMLLMRRAAELGIPMTVTYSGNNITLLSDNNIKSVTLDGQKVAPGSSHTLSDGDHIVEYYFKDLSNACWERAFVLNGAVTSMVIPEGVTVIKEGFALAANHLTNVTLPESITSIEANAFSQTNVVFNGGDLYLPNVQSLRSISSGTVMNTFKLGSITTFGVSDSYGDAAISQWTLNTLDLPDTLTTMTDNCIDRCNIQNIIIRATTPPTLSGPAKDPFFQSSIIARTKIYVPAASLNLYKTAPGWSYYASVMYPLESLYVTFYDYVTNTGNGWNPAYLDLGVSAPSSSSEISTVTVELDVQYNPDAGSTPAPILGALVTESGTKCEGSCYTYGNFRIDFNGRTSGYQLMQDLTERHTYKYTYQVGGEITNLYKDGVVVSNPYIDSSTFSSTLNNNFILFGSYQPAWGRVDCTTNVIRIYGIKIWKDGELVMDGYPAVSMETNDAGIFNYVTGSMCYGGDRSLISVYNN